MAAAGQEDTDELRTAELIGSLCLATDLGMGFPLEHGLHTTSVAMRLAGLLRVSDETAAEVYYASLLAHAGCTTEVHVAAEIFGSSMTRHFHPVKFGSPRESLGGLLGSLPDEDAGGVVRLGQVVRRLPRMVRESKGAISASCEVAGMLAARTGAPASVPSLLGYLTERWDGRGPLRRASGDTIPLPVRIVQVAVDATFQAMISGQAAARSTIAERAGGAFDPEIAGCLVDNAPAVLAPNDATAWESVLAAEPMPHRLLRPDQVDEGLAAIGQFADLVSPDFLGHSAAVAQLAGLAAQRLGVADPEATLLRRAARVHDIGRVAVHPRVWNKPSGLDAEEAEQVRLHPYYTERILSRSRPLSALSAVAGAHHEHLDGSGYHRGSAAAQLAPLARLLAAAVAYQAKREPRSYRAPLSADEAAGFVVGEAAAGRLDPDAVAAVVAAAGQPLPHVTRPAGLTARECEILVLLSRGHLTSRIAHRLGISPKTVDTHIQSAYRKIGVSSRAAATLFTTEHGLVNWGELPMGPGRPNS